MKQKFEKIIASLILSMMIIASCSSAIVYAVNGILSAGASQASSSLQDSIKSGTWKASVISTRSDGSTYSIDGYEIKDYAISNWNDDNPYTYDMYCLDAYADIGTYNYKANMTNDSMISDIKDIFSNEKNYKAMQWLAKNMYVVTNSSINDSKQKDYMKQNLKIIINKYASGYKTYSKYVDELEPEFITVIQKYVVWEFVNHRGDKTGYYKPTIKSESDIDKITWTGKSSSNWNENKRKAAYALYTALKNGATKYAENPSSNYTISEKADNGLTITANNKKITKIDSTTYRMGPIKVSANSDRIDFININFNFSGITVTNRKYTDANGNAKSTQNIENYIKQNEEFYIQFNTSQKVTNVTYNVYAYFTPYISNLDTNIYYNSTNKNVQSLLGISKTLAKPSNNASATFTYSQPEEKPIDLALTKEINKIYRYDNTSKAYNEIFNSNNASDKRLKSINNNTIATKGTAEYIMNKTPVTVAPGDIIRYKITVYNEGSRDAIVKTIRDYLPKGLEYLDMTKETKSTNYGEQNYKNKNSLTYNEYESGTNNYDVIRYYFGSKSNNTGIVIKQGNSTSIYIECKVANNAEANSILKNVAAITNYGYKNDSGTYVECTKEGIDRDSVQINLTANFAEYTNSIDTKSENNDLSEIDKGILVEEDDEDFEQVKVGYFDLALRKFITEVNSIDGNTYKYDDKSLNDRSPLIYSNTLTTFNNGGTTANYYHTKKPVSVNNGDHIIYTIRIFNEGYIGGYAKQITDYLPNGLTLVDTSKSEINAKYGWSKGVTNSYGTTVKSTYLKDTLINPSNGAEKFKQVYQETHYTSDYAEDKFFVDIQIECEVNGASNGTILTNMAEISSSGYYRGESWAPTSDIDSNTNTLSKDLTNNGVSPTGNGYFKYQENEGHSIKNNENNKYYEGLEDDDDFENIIVNSNFDLALRKFITKVNDQDLEEDYRRVNNTLNLGIVDSDSAKYLQTYGTAEYHNKKIPVKVNYNDIVTYTIRIYNEGNITGYAQEITDYLPVGLEFVTNSKINKNNGWTETKNSDGTTTIKTTKLAGQAINPSNGYTGYSKLANNTLSESEYFWKDVQVQCKVITANNGIKLTNVAEISNYAYKDSSGKYVYATKEGVQDRDSAQNNVFSSTNISDEINNYHSEQKPESIDKDVFVGRQDDDDFETLIVDQTFEYDIKLYKQDQDGKGIAGAKFTIEKTEAQKYGIDVENYYNGTETKNKETILDEVIGSSGKEITDGSLYANTTYFFRVNEIESADGYINILDGYTIFIPYYIDNKAQAHLDVYNANSNSYFGDNSRGFVILDEKNNLVEESSDLYNMVDVDLNSKGEISITVKNTKIEGAYSLFIYKRDENNEPLTGFSFSYEKNKDYKTTTNIENKTTKDSNNIGLIAVSSKENIENEGVDKYTFTEIQDGNDDYIKLAEPFTLYVYKVEKDGEYTVDKVSLEENNETTTKNYKLQNGDTAEVSVIKKENNKIVLTAKNKKKTGSYGLQILKIGESSATKLSGVTFDVINENANTTERVTTASSGIAKLANKTIEKPGQDVYTIKEISLGYNSYIPLSEEGIKLYVNTEEINYNYKATIVSFDEITNETTYQTATKEIDVKLKNGETVKAEAIIENEVVKVTIKNIPISGSYDLKFKKVDDEGNLLNGVKFRYTIGTSATIYKTAETQNGEVKARTVQITKNNVDTTDVYTITEIILYDKPYIDITPVTLYVTKELAADYTYKASKVSFVEGEEGADSKIFEATLKNGEKINVEAIVDCGEVILTIPNKKITGSYDFEIKKTDEEGNIVPGVSFNVSENDEAEASFGPTNEESGTVEIAKDKEITAIGVDKYTISEIDLGENDYIAIEEPINLYVNKVIKDYEYVVQDVSLDEIGTGKAILHEKEVTISDGSKLKVKVSLENGKVTLTIPNKKIAGTYNLYLKKVYSDNSNKTISGVVFAVSENDGNAIEYKATSEAGNTLIANHKAITETGEDKYTIEEVKLNGFDFVKLSEKVDIYLKKEIVDSEYKVSDVSFESFTGGKTAVRTKNVKLEDNTEVNLQAVIRANGNIVVYIPNKKITGSYSLDILKTDTNNNPVQGMNFTVSDGTNINTYGSTNSDGKVNIVNNKEILETGTDEYIITEVRNNNTTTGGADYIKLKDELKLVLNKEIVNYEYTVTKVAFDNLTSNSTANAEKDIVLENGEKAKATVTVENGVVTLSIQNKKITGNYNLYINKVDSSTGNTISGINFKVKENDENEKVCKTANALGYKIIAENKEITETGTDKFTISEIVLNNAKYIKLKNPVDVYVKKEVNSNYEYEITEVSFNPIYPGLEPTKTISEVLEDNLEIVELTAEITDKNEVTLTIPNKPITGTYGLQIEKLGENEDIKLKGVEFDVGGQTYTTNDDGLATIFESKQITKEGIDTITVKEVSVGDNGYIKLKNSLPIYVEKKLDGYKYKVSRVSLSKITLNAGDAITEKDVPLVTGDNVTVKLSVDEQTGLITLTVANKPMEGTYIIKIRKVENETNNPISGIKFKVSKNGEEITTSPSSTNSLGRINIGNGYQQISEEDASEPDEYIINEIDLNDKPYVSLENALKVYVHKGIVGNAYKATSVSFSKDDLGSSSVETNVKLQNNKDVTVKAYIEGSIVFVEIPNEPITGKYNFAIKKVDADNNSALEGAMFTVTKNDKEERTLDATDSNGKKTIIENEEITAVGVDKYTIREIGLENDTYVPLGEEIDVYLKKEIDNNEYKVTSYAFNDISDANESAQTTKEVKLKNGETVEARLEKDDTGTIYVIVPNKKITGKYTFSIRKKNEDTNGYIGNVTFKYKDYNANKEGEVVTRTDGYGIIARNKEIADVGQDKFTISEIKTPTNSYISINEPIDVYLKKELDTENYEYRVTAYSFEDFNSNSEAVTTKKVLLADNKTEVTLTIKKISSSPDSITVVISNKEISGSYNLEIKKVDESSNAISGVYFNVSENDEITGKNYGPTGSNGKKTIFTGKTITSENVDNIDKYTISEVKLPNDSYAQLKEKIDIYVEKTLDTNNYVYKANRVSFDSFEEGKSAITNKEVTLEDGTKVNLKLTLSTKGTITVTVPNKKIQGSYGMEIVKTDTSGSSIKGVSFTVGEGSGSAVSNKQSYGPSGDNGVVSVFNNKSIEGKGIDSYTISEIDLGENQYLRLKDSLEIYVKKDIVNYKYEVSKVSFDKLEDENVVYNGVIDSASVSKEVLLEDESTVVTVKAEIVNGKVVITIPNEKVTGKYNLYLKKIDSSTKLDSSNMKVISGVVFKVSENDGASKILQPSDSNGNKIIASGKVITEEGEDKYTVEEIDLNGNNYIKLAQKIDIYIKKEKVGTEFKATKVSFESFKDENGNEKEAVTSKKAILEDGTEVELESVIRKNGTIVVAIPNKKITGSYGLEIVKTDENGSKLEGISFKVKEGTGNQAQNEQTYGVTNSEGKVTIFANKEIIQVGEDSYTVSEVSLNGKDYISLKNELPIYVKKDIVNYKYTASNASFESFEGKTVTTIGDTKEVELEDGTKVNVKLEVKDGVITLTIPNKKIKGLFGVEIAKTDLDGNKIEGVNFKVSRNSGEEKEFGPTVENSNLTIINSEEITKEETEQLTITEIKVDENRYLKLNNPVNVYLQKQISNYSYKVTKVSFEEILSDSTKEYRTKQVLLEDNETEVTLKLDVAELEKVVSGEKINYDMITITIPNKKLEGSYSIQALKTDTNNSPLSGISFKIKEGIGANAGNEITSAKTSSNGIATLLNNVKINSVGVDSYTISEINLNNKLYIKLKDNLELYVKTERVGNKFEAVSASLKPFGANGEVTNSEEVYLEDETTKVTVKVDVEDGVVTLTIPNKKITGKESLYIYKVDADTNKGISGINFKVTWPSGTSKWYNKTGSTGIKTIFSSLTMSVPSVDKYTVEEIEIDENKYLSLKEPVDIYIKKEVIDYKIVATKVSFEDLNLDENNVKLEKEVYLKDDNTKVNLKLSLDKDSTGEIDVIKLFIPNKKLEGTYDLEIKKVDESGNGLSGVKFGVKQGVGSTASEQKTYGPTADNGIVTVFTGKVIENIGIDSYTISEIDVGTNNYIRLKDSLEVYVKKEIVGDKYVATEVSFENIEDGKANVSSKEVLLEDDETNVTVSASIVNGKVTITIPNKEMTGKYNLYLKKIDSSTKLDSSNMKTIPGVIYKVSENDGEGKILQPSDSNGNKIIASSKVITEEGEDKYTVEEIDLNGNNYIKLAQKIDIYIKKEIVGTSFKATKISFESFKDENGNEKEAVTSRKATLEDGTEVELESVIRKNGTIVVAIPNKKITGSYGLEIVKTDENGSKLEGISFKVKEGTGSQAQNEQTYGATNSEGKVTIFANKEITQVGEDSYTVSEVSLNGKDYISLKNELPIYVKKDIVNYKYTASNASFESFEGKTVTTIGDTKEVELEDGTKVNVKLEVKDGVITLTIPNKKIKGLFGVEIAKTDLDGNKIEGVNFKVSRNSGEEKEFGPTVEDSNLTIINSEEITKEETEQLTITEVKVDENKYVKLNEPINVYYKKAIKDYNYKITKVSFDKIYTDATKESRTKVVTLVDNTEVTLKLDITELEKVVSGEKINFNMITISIPNKKLEGSYSIKALKTDTDNSPLSGISFKIKEGIGANATNETISSKTNSNGITTLLDNVKINSIGVDSYTISEINLNDKLYIKLKDNLELYVKTGKVENQYGVTSVSLKPFGANGEATESEEVYLEDEKTKVTVEVSQDNGVVTLTIPNKRITGTHGLYIYKVDADTKEGIANVNFKVTWPSGTSKWYNKTNEKGIKTIFSKLTMTKESVDKYTIEEVQVDENTYIPLKDQIDVYLKKEIVDYEYKVTKVSFEDLNADENNVVTSKEVLLKDGKTKVTIYLTLDSNIIIVTIPNKKQPGSYGLEIVKTDLDGNNLANVSFKVSKNNNEDVTYGPTDDKTGKVVITENQSITEEGIDEYTIKEVILGQNPYIPINSSLKVYVKKEVENNKYVVKTASFEKIEDEKQATTSKEVLLSDNETKVNVKLEVVNGKVIITIPNKRIEGTYSLELNKVDENNTPIKGVEFTVQTNEEKQIVETTDENGKIAVVNKKAIEDVGQDKYTIKEINIDTTSYIKLKDEVDIFVKKEIVNNKYEVTDVSFEEFENNTSNSLEISEISKTKQVLLEDGKTVVTLKAEILSPGLISITIPNKKVAGSYDFEIYKTDEENNPLPGVDFKVKENNQAEVLYKQTEQGKVEVVKNKKIDGIGTDVYTITEVVLNNKPYISLKNSLNVYVKKDYINYAYAVSKVSFENFAENSDKSVISKEVELKNGDKVTVKLELENGVVKLTVPNKKIVGSYGMEILKLDDENKPLEGVSFKVQELDNKEVLYGPSLSDGKVEVYSNKEIKEVGIDEYVVSEILLNNKPYVTLKNSLNVYVKKEIVNYEYKATSVSLEKFEGDTAKAVVSKEVQLQNGEKVTVKAELKDGKVLITIPNHIIKGKYDLELLKVDKKDSKTPIKDVTFDITVKKGSEEITLYDVNGNAIETKGLVTDSEGKIKLQNINLAEIANYTYEITETKVPKGYTMLKLPIIVNMNSVIDNYEYVVQKAIINNEASNVSEDASITYDKHTITIKAENGQFDLALRKFITGVTKNVGTDTEKFEEIQSRIPTFKVTEEGNYVYEHTKEPVLVANQNIVEYTLRVYNEGTIDGYASKIKDDIPEGLEFLPEDETNKKYGWILLDEQGNEVKEVNKAKYIVTDYLSKENEESEGENLLKAFSAKDYEAGTIKEPNYKEVKVAFKVTIPNTDDRIIVNQAQISEHTDKDENDINDKDSNPDEWIDGEDDQDIEKIKVLSFDLALRKWVTKAIVIDEGKETITDTHHKAEDDPEEVVKVDLQKSKLNKVVVKFEYKIRVTNEGEIAGTVKEISDYIPQGLKFDVADNPLWEIKDDIATTKQLEDIVLQPGESKEVSIILTWINKSDNMGLKENVAEISKDYNEYGSPDIDSTPGNKVPGEDDIDDAPVMLTVKTGQEVIIQIGLVTTVIAMLGVGVVAIKKYVI